MDLGIENRVAIVTGAGGGLGEAIARMLAENGAAVAVADIDEDRAGEVAASICGNGGRAAAVGVNVTEEKSVASMLEAVRTTLNGAPDILINNAGFTRDKLLVKMDEADWNAVIDVVLKGAFLCTRACLPEMAARSWGRIVSISSRAHLGNPGQGNYSAAKAGLVGFTRAMALENGRFNITVNAVAPGIAETAAVRGLPHFDKIAEKARQTLPIKRLGRVDDVADAVAFLASERASYITGELLHVTGGRYG